MLEPKDLKCAWFDSNISRKNLSQSPPRTVREYEIELYRTNQGTCFVDGRAVSIQRGTLLCAKPGMVRYSLYPIRSSYLRIAPTSSLSAVLERLPLVSQICRESELEALEQLHRRIHLALEETGDTEQTLLMNALLLQFLHRLFLLGKTHPQNGSPGETVTKVKRYLDEHCSEDCSLNRLAEEIHLSPGHLHAVFTREIGMTPYDYLMEKRLEKAKAMISGGEASLTQIALECGFCSQSHFTLVFRKKTGLTPSQYRRQLFYGL